MGSCYIGHCPAMPLPQLIICTAVFGMFFMLCALYEVGVRSSSSLRKERTSMKVFLPIFTILFIAETFHYLISISFDAESSKYCNEVFYYYSIGFNILTFLLLTFGWGTVLLLYIPDRLANAIELNEV
ncbi:unnamed protein product [Larinioides sclopetarius]